MLRFLPCSFFITLATLAINESAYADPSNPPSCTQDGLTNHTQLVKAFPNLPALPSPLAMVQPLTDDSFWFVASRDGVIFKIENTSEASELDVVFDIKEKVNNQVEMGLTSLTFHPDYPKDNRLFFTYNDLRNNNRSTLAYVEVDIETATILPDSEKVMLTLPQEALFHNGGHVVFGPDNYLYVGFGDGGTTLSEAQNTESLYGTLIRIDVSTSPYSIPEDNPFNKGQASCANGVGKKDCPEIYAYGFRNPWRYSFDRKTKTLWLSDVGEADFEEINLVEPSKNYGWPKTEGDSCFDSFFCISWGTTDPHNGYDLVDQPQSIAGGYVYRGTAIPALQGHYIYGDMLSQNFYGLDANAAANAEPTMLFNSGFLVASLAEGNDGEIYLLNFSGVEAGDGIYKIVQNESCKPL